MEVEDDEVNHSNDNGLTDGIEVVCGGIVTEFKKLLSKRTNKEMAIAKMEDLYGQIDLMLFPNVYSKYKGQVDTDSLIKVKGKLSIRDGERPSVLVDTIEPLAGENKQREEVQEKPKTLYLKYDLQNIELHENVYNLLSEYKGATPVIVRCASTNKIYKLNLFIDASGSLLTELHAYIKDEFIKLQ